MVQQMLTHELPAPGVTQSPSIFSGFVLPVQSVVTRQPTASLVHTPSQSVQATPPLLLIGTLSDDRLRLTAPIEVQIEREGASYIVKFEEVDEFGYGDSPMQAIDDLKATVAELYWVLKEEQRSLGRGLAQTWERLRVLIEER